PTCLQLGPLGPVGSVRLNWARTSILKLSRPLCDSNQTFRRLAFRRCGDEMTTILIGHRDSHHLPILLQYTAHSGFAFDRHIASGRVGPLEVSARNVSNSEFAKCYSRGAEFARFETL